MLTRRCRFVASTGQDKSLALAVLTHACTVAGQRLHSGIMKTSSALLVLVLAGCGPTASDIRRMCMDEGRQRLHDQFVLADGMTSDQARAAMAAEPDRTEARIAAWTRQHCIPHVTAGIQEQQRRAYVGAALGATMARPPAQARPIRCVTTGSVTRCN